MNLDVASNVARQAMIATQSQIALSGRNVAAAGDPTRSRAIAMLATTIDGGVRVASVRRAEDSALYTRMINATSATAKADAILTHLTVLSDTVGDPQDGVSVGATIGDLQTALADYANAPDDALFGRTVIERARDVANTLNRAANEIYALRERADANMADSVAKVNDLLVQFDRANGEVKSAIADGRDATDWQDRRDAIVAQMSEHLGVTVMVRGGGDMALYTDSGITLFDKLPRAVEFVRTPVYTAGTLGGTVTVDGMPITGPASAMPVQGGAIVGNAAVRDEVAPTYRLQMDEIARVLEATFEDGPGSLFIFAGALDLSGTITVNPGVDPTQGGDVELLRDGTGNAAGVAGYPDRLLALGETMAATVVAIDPAAQLSDQATLLDLSSGSAGWLEKVRQSASDVSMRESSILTTASDALGRTTGVNLDDEYAQQLTIERNFAASSKLISIIEQMFATLLEMT